MATILVHTGMLTHTGILAHSGILAHPGHRHGYGPSLSELRPVALVVVALLLIAWLAVVAVQSRRHRSGSRASGSDTTRAPGTGHRPSGEE